MVKLKQQKTQSTQHVTYKHENKRSKMEKKKHMVPFIDALNPC